MASIKRVRLANIIYDNGNKRYNDTIFDFDSEHSVILLKNGFGKTVFIQLVLQTVIPHISINNRKIKDTLNLMGEPAHIAVEWEISQKPKVYATTAVSLYQDNQDLKSIKYVYKYNAKEENYIETIPFSIYSEKEDARRPASKFELLDYYNEKKSQTMMAKTFDTNTEYSKYLERELGISGDMWRKIALINKTKGGMDAFFQNCSTTRLLVDNLLVPVAEDVILKKSKGNFVETFESQRDNFKKNKDLNRKIKELEVLKSQLDQYLNSYEKHNEKSLEADYALLELQELKRHIQSVVEENRKGISQIEEDVIELEEKLLENQYQRVSLDAWKKEEEIQETESKRAELLREKDEHENRLDSYSMEYQNILLSKVHIDLSSEKVLLEEVREKLEEQDKSVDVQDLIEGKNQVLSQIKGYYERHFESIEKEIKDLEQKLSIQERDYKTLDREESKNQRVLNDLKEEIGGLKKNVEIFEKDIEDLLKILLIESQDVSDVIYKITKRTMELQEEQVETQKTIGSLEDEIKSYNEKKETLMEERANILAQKTKLSLRVETIEEGGYDTISKLLPVYNRGLGDVGDLYLKESKLLSELKDVLWFEV